MDALTVMKDGIYYDLSRRAYDALTDRQNFSRFSVIGKSSPAHFQHMMLNPEDRKVTDDMLVGLASHHAVLEPAKFRASYCVWEGGRRAGNAWDAICARAEAEDRSVLTLEQHKTALEIGKAVRSHEDAGKYFKGGKSEVSVLWTTTVPLMRTLPNGGVETVDVQVKLKSRIDFVADVGALVDLKSVRSAKPEKFGKQCLDFEWHTQSALYSDAWVAAGGRPLPYRIVPIEKKPPYVLQVYRVPERYLKIGRDRYREWLTTLVACQDSNLYPPYAKGEVDLELPRWAVPDDEDDPEGMGLTF